MAAVSITSPIMHRLRILFLRFYPPPDSFLSILLFRLGPLVPRLTTPGVIKDVDVWRIAVMRPGDSLAGPFAALAVALMQDEAALPKEEEGRGPARPQLGP